MNHPVVLTGQKYRNAGSGSIWRVLGKDMTSNPPLVRMVDDSRPTIVHSVKLDDLLDADKFRRQP